MITPIPTWIRWILAALSAMVCGGYAVAAPSLSLEDALRIAEERSAQLEAQRSAAQAASAMVGPASQNPDPKLTFGVENVPVSGAERWSLTSDGMTMRRIGVMQDFVRGEKLEARTARARADAERELALLEAQKIDLRREVATAWLERHYAALSQALLEAQMREADLQASSARADVASGRGTGADAISVLSLRATLADRLEESRRQERRATAMLSRWLGEAAERDLGEGPDVTRLARDVRALEADIDNHPDLAQYAPMQAAAEADLRLAAAATKPDWSLEVSYGIRGSLYPDMVNIMVRTELPFFASTRQDPVTEARRRQLDQVRAQSEEARRRHAAEIHAAMADWEAARSRHFRYRDEIIPLARERERAVVASYEVGRAGLPTVIEARRTTLEAKMNAVAVEAELARAWAQLAFLVQELPQR